MKKKYSALPDSMKDMEMYGFHCGWSSSSRSPRPCIS